VKATCLALSFCELGTNAYIYLRLLSYCECGVNGIFIVLAKTHKNAIKCEKV